MPDLLTILFIGFAALGIWMLVRGWRGRRVDNHPWCRRCRFDLFGLPGESLRCPECGTDLKSRGAVRHGHRRRRPIPLGAGVLVLALIATWVILDAAGVLAKVNWNQYKPTWWLAIEARSLDAPSLPPVLDELRSRLERGELGEERIEALARVGINNMQTAFADGVPSQWDQFILRAWRLHHLSDESKLRYAPMFLQTEVFVQPATIDGQSAMMLAGGLAQRRRAGDGWYRVKVISLSLDGEDATVPAVSYDELPGRGIRERLLPQMLAGPFACGFETPRLAEAIIEWRIAPGFGAYDTNHESTGVAWQTRHVFTRADFDANRPVIELVTDDATREVLLGAVFARCYAVRAEGEGPRKGAGVLGFHNPPVDVQAMMTVRSGDLIVARGGDVTAAGVGSRGGQGGSSRLFTLELPNESITSLELVLEPHWFFMPTLRRGAEGPIPVWYAPLHVPAVQVQWFDDPNDERIPENMRDMIYRIK